MVPNLLNLRNLCNDLLKDLKNIVLIAFFILFVGSVFFYAKYTGFILLFAFLTFGIFSTIWKSKNTRFLALALLLLLSITNIMVNGIKFGIDFSGGTRIPVILEKAVNEQIMNDMLQIIKNRASVLGLTEVKVRAIGTSQIDVEVPGTNDALIKNIEEVLSHQGVFQGIVDGKLAIDGKNILPGTIGQIPVSQLQGADWGVGFSVTKEGANNFANVSKGKANYPLYMFLDRPKNVVIFISMEELKTDKLVSDKNIIEAASKSLRFENEDIPLYILDNFDFDHFNNSHSNNFNSSNNYYNSNNSLIINISKTKALISKNLDNATKEKIRALGFNLSEVQNISPVFGTSASSYEKKEFVERWEAIGLLSAPLLSPAVTAGAPSYHYSISGSVRGTSSGSGRNGGYDEVKRITSILKGGSLPVQISLGSRTSIPAPLGQQFLQFSVFGVFASILAIAFFISIRYMRLKIILPILMVSISELVILVSLLGSFTIDLAAMAGILAAIGVGVDAQIVITDELVKKDNKNNEEKLGHAFSIITMSVMVAVIAMIPLLFSSMAEIIGFALSTIIGSLLGFMISRPVYALLVERIIRTN
ncbi:MAG: hypothetical protein AB1391_01285 [Candidatus Micrarchaeota archaeon]